ncbi:hypothetical protein DFJ58DRAFT_806570 [Suillus subalutaceus]|uniref:uncharacterized protein n=1 Tax=Suillus subalutaceus TaxID=48586 RepID=UPI001B86DFC0|nr:uncharacterized protein DFJ58DRAFT_806570 [Suillus subalutaceus]KAG1842248.1 hypothetical protein DFJ58DRAFT_806570 [Suillus subalutaceus]
MYWLHLQTIFWTVWMVNASGRSNSSSLSACTSALIVLTTVINPQAPTDAVVNATHGIVWSKATVALSVFKK